MLPAIVDLRFSPDGASLPRDHRLSSGQQAAGSRQREAGLKRETIAANNPFLLHVVVHVLHGVKTKVPFPQFLLNHG